MDRATATRRLAGRWGVTVPVHEVYVEHHERVVFGTVTPTGRRAVVKAFADPNRLAVELAAIHAAAAAGVVVPEVVDRLPGMLVLAWLDGRPLLSASPDPHWAAAGRTLRRLHDHAATGGVPGFAGSDDWWSWFRGCLPKARPRIRELCPAAAATRLCRVLEVGIEVGSEVGSGPTDVPPTCLLHGDSTSIHWRIRDDGSAGMLDLGDAGVGDPVWDLVVLTHWDAARLPAVLDGYGADHSLRVRVDRLFQPYQVVRHLLAVDWLLDHGYDPAATIRELDRLATQPTPPTVVVTGGT
jgi:Ser/Thr protein kinase RdoA (MazF antagonist)